MEVPLTEVLLPRIAVGVELHEAERPVPPREHTQLGKRDRVIATEGEREDTRVDERPHRLFDLRIGALGVPRRHRQVTVVDDR